MASLLTIQDYCNGGHPLEQRFLAGRQQVAWNILAENAGAPTAPRRAWAVKIFTDYRADLGKEYRWFLSHPNVQNGTALAVTTPGDTALIAAVASFVDAWA